MGTMMKRIQAGSVVFCGMLLLSTASAQQATEAAAAKRSADKAKPAATKKASARNAGSARQEPASGGGGGVTVDPAVIAAAQAELKAQAEARAAALELANKTNPFNRTMRPLGRMNLPPIEDGIHDPGMESIKTLNTPLDAYTHLPRNKAGNRVDWVAALDTGKISPRWDRADPNAEGLVMDMDILRLVKGSMPNVLFPHKQHTEWLACSNCHPAIFVPQKGANQISMSMILSGQKCGVCHGKVAFPPSDCLKCHSQKKEMAQNGT